VRSYRALASNHCMVCQARVDTTRYPTRTIPLRIKSHTTPSPSHSTRTPSTRTTYNPTGVTLTPSHSLPDTYCEVADVPRPPSQILSNDKVVALTHTTEVATESIPQAVFQTAVLVSMKPEDRASVQFLSILASLLTTAYVSATSGEQRPARAYSAACRPKQTC